MFDDQEIKPAAPRAAGGRTNPYWWQRLFATIDSGDAAGFVQMLTPDARFRFGNEAEVSGAPAILAAVGGFLASIRSSRHQLLECWAANELAGCEGRVTYTRHDGSEQSFPFANIFKLRGEKILAYHIYIDISPLYRPAG
jgi:ketosteroid isomerase-like protein